MNEIQNFFSNLHVYVQAIIIGLAGGILSKDNKNLSMNNAEGWRRFLANFVASLSSAFICLIVYLIVHSTTGSEEAGLGIGGFCAYKGAEWTKNRMHKLLDRRVFGSDYRGYSYGGDLEGAGIDRRKKYEDDEVSEFKNLDESDKGEKVEDTIYK